ncbi:Uncharacterized protein DAT39_020702, partial [Clarias magur]
NPAQARLDAVEDAHLLTQCSPKGELKGNAPENDLTQDSSQSIQKEDEYVVVPEFLDEEYGPDGPHYEDG